MMRTFLHSFDPAVASPDGGINPLRGTPAMGELGDD